MAAYVGRLCAGGEFYNLRLERQPSKKQKDEKKYYR